jgi:hypothetical protein
VRRNALLVFVCAAALAAAAVPALGSGGKNHYEGKGTAGLFIGFDVVKKNGQIKTVKNVLWDELRITCNGQTDHVSGSFNPPLKVKNGAFSGGVDADAGGRVTFAGHFIKHNKKAKGTVEVKGSTAHCGSGTINWTVTRG